MIIKFLKIILIFLLPITAQSALASTPWQIQASINKTLKQYPDINAGIMVQSLTHNKILYQKNPSQLFMPASILKIFTAIAALSFLGPDYRFQTKILAKTASINQGEITSDLYFYFDGDPSLKHQNIDALIKKLTTLGINTINGNIYIDSEIFDDSLLGPGWVWDDLNFCYASPISAIMIDKNCFSLKLTAAKKSGLPAILTKNNNVPIINNVISRNPNSSCSVKLRASNNNNYSLSGCLKTNAPPIDLSIAVRNVHSFAKSVIVEKLNANNIKLLGSIEFKKTPTDAPLSTLAEHQSEPLSEPIRTMLKKSDNTIADTIYKKLGSAFFNKQSTWQDGASAIKNILAPRNNAFFKNMYMDDGSGLSRYNQITPALLVAALSYAYHKDAIRQVFISSLPNAGVDGTLKYRMPNLRNHVYAKTGNMENSSSLTGYVKTKNQEVLAFAIIINSFLGSPKKYHKLQDEICNILAGS